MPGFDILNDDVLFVILLHLSPNDWSAFARVSRALRAVYDSNLNILWRDYFLRKFQALEIIEAAAQAGEFAVSNPVEPWSEIAQQFFAARASLLADREQANERSLQVEDLDDNAAEEARLASELGGELSLIRLMAFTDLNPEAIPNMSTDSLKKISADYLKPNLKLTCAWWVSLYPQAFAKLFINYMLCLSMTPESYLVDMNLNFNLLKNNCLFPRVLIQANGPNAQKLIDKLASELVSRQNTVSAKDWQALCFSVMAVFIGNRRSDLIGMLRNAMPQFGDFFDRYLSQIVLYALRVDYSLAQLKGLLAHTKVSIEKNLLPPLLHAAIKCTDLAIYKWFASLRPGLVEDVKGRTLLHSAVMSLKAVNVEYVLAILPAAEKRRQLTQFDRDDKQPLYYAGSIRAVDCLVRAGAPIKVFNTEHKTPLMVLITQIGMSPSCLQLMLREPSLVNMTKSGITALGCLFTATELRLENVLDRIKMLVDRGARLAAYDKPLLRQYFAKLLASDCDPKLGALELTSNNPEVWQAYMSQLNGKLTLLTQLDPNLICNYLKQSYNKPTALLTLNYLIGKQDIFSWVEAEFDKFINAHNSMKIAQHYNNLCNLLTAVNTLRPATSQDPRRLELYSKMALSKRYNPVWGNKLRELLLPLGLPLTSQPMTRMAR